MKYSYDRKGNVMQIPDLPENPSEEQINIRHALEDFRGVYDTPEQAKSAFNASQPVWVATGNDGSGYWL